MAHFKCYQWVGTQIQPCRETVSWGRDGVLFHWYYAPVARLLFAAARRVAGYGGISRNLGGRYLQTPTPYLLQKAGLTIGACPLWPCVKEGQTPFATSRVPGARRSRIPAPLMSLFAHRPAGSVQKRSFRPAFVCVASPYAHSFRSCVHKVMYGSPGAGQCHVVSDCQPRGTEAPGPSRLARGLGRA